METPENTQPQKNQNGTDMEPLNEFDQNHFYETNHVDSDVLAEKDRSTEDLTSQEISGTASISDRIAEEKKLQQNETHEITENPDLPMEEDGKTLMDVGRAPDS